MALLCALEFLKVDIYMQLFIPQEVDLSFTDIVVQFSEVLFILVSII